jgi:hypothetical protein
LGVQVSILVKVLEDIIFKSLEVSSHISTEFQYLVPLCVGGAIYLIIQGNKDIKFISSFVILGSLLASPIMSFAPTNYYAFWAVSRGKLVTSFEHTSFFILVLLTLLIMWLMHRNIDSICEKIATLLRKKSSQKQRSKTDIERMHKDGELVPFDPLKLEKQGFIALGRKS